MKDLNLNDLLRYFLVGIFFILMLYIVLDKSYVAEQIKIFGNKGVFGLITVVGLTVGSIIYVFYRAFFYPLIINPLVTWSLTRIYKRKFSNLDTPIIKFIDLKRWTSEDQRLNKLSEWASQVHFLYNLATVNGLIWIISIFWKDLNSIETIKYVFIILLIASVIHHIRYKIREMDILTDATHN